jgi:hypothetical protein
MRSTFPAYFRPSVERYQSLWKDSLFVLDANVLLNLYRYSPETRKELESALNGVRDQLFITHQAAKEFLRNRLVVTAGQADEYNKAIKAIAELTATISNKKKHPFLDDGELPPFIKITQEVTKQLETQKERLLKRLTDDEILDYVENLFDSRTGSSFDDEQMAALVLDGEKRYEKEIPPGYKDSKKDPSNDPYRKFGDLIVWKQLIAQAKISQKSVIFVTDDQKEDWWLEQSGRTIGPRPELREEFLKESGQDFWMYTVDKFIEESARNRKTVVSEQVLAEIIEVRAEANTNWGGRRGGRFRNITREELLSRIESSERWAYENGVPFLGLVSYVKNYLGNAGFDYDYSFELIKELQNDGVIEIYNHQGPGHEHSVAAIRLTKNKQFLNRPFEALKEKMSSESSASDG